jgi:hypothetical protein
MPEGTRESKENRRRRTTISEVVVQRRKCMHVVNKLMRFKMAVSDMPKAKAFYVDKLGLKVETDYRRDEHNWWVSLTH